MSVSWQCHKKWYFFTIKTYKKSETETEAQPNLARVQVCFCVCTGQRHRLYGRNALKPFFIINSITGDGAKYVYIYEKLD